MSYRHASYRKMSAAVKKAGRPYLNAPSENLTHSEMDRVLHWSNQAPLPKPEGWGRPKGWRWPEGAACTDCAPDGVCERGCVDQPRNPKARPVNAA